MVGAILPISLNKNVKLVKIYDLGENRHEEQYFSVVPIQHKRNRVDVSEKTK